MKVKQTEKRRCHIAADIEVYRIKFNKKYDADFE